MKIAHKRKTGVKKLIVAKKALVRKPVKKNGFFKGGAKNGALYAIAILAIVGLFGGIMTGGPVPDVLNMKLPPPPHDPYSCCDTGDGALCHPITEKTLSFNGDTYALLKSNIYMGEGGHIVPTDLAGYPASFSPDGHKIFINTSNKTAHYTIPGCESGKDLIAIKDPTATHRPCFGLADEEVIYVCEDTVEECSKRVNRTRVPFDAYFRISRNETVPFEVASYCPKPKAKNSETPQRVVGLPTPSGAANLQLETFKVEQKKTTYDWLGAWCKPADYFYPTEKTNIHFDVKPQGNLVYTNPLYVKGGWDFTAFPDGRLLSQNKYYPYIYWDAAIPNNLITKPDKGFVVEYSNLSKTLGEILQKTGLNQKETKEFIEYWEKQLPESKYYYIGLIPQAQINKLAPLSITPEPTSILRVSLYFEPIDENKEVVAPRIEPFIRSGFTVIEWGAIFDTKKHPGFSCLM